MDEVYLKSKKKKKIVKELHLKMLHHLHLKEELLLIITELLKVPYPWDCFKSPIITGSPGLNTCFVFRDLLCIEELLEVFYYLRAFMYRRPL